MQVGEETACQGSQLGHLVRRQGIEDESANCFDVAGGGLFDGGSADGCEAESGTTPVGLALLPFNQVPPLHPGELVGEAALFPGERGAESAGAQPVVGGVVEAAEYLVVGEGDAVLVLELPAQYGLELRGQVDQPAPCLLFLGRQPRGHEGSLVE